MKADKVLISEQTVNYERVRFWRFLADVAQSSHPAVNQRIFRFADGIVATNGYIAAHVRGLELPDGWDSAAIEFVTPEQQIRFAMVLGDGSNSFPMFTGWEEKFRDALYLASMHSERRFVFDGAQAGEFWWLFHHAASMGHFLSEKAVDILTRANFLWSMAIPSDTPKVPYLRFVFAGEKCEANVCVAESTPVLRCPVVEEAAQ